MGTALLALSSLFAPIQSWVSRHADARRGAAIDDADLRYVTVLPHHHRRPASANEAMRRTAGARPLRVVRVVEPGQRGAAGSRLVIAGRMADVCAELDRLVEKELRDATVRPCGTPLH